MAEIVIRDAADEEAVRAFLDTEWVGVDPDSWTSARRTFVAERDGAIIGAAVCRCAAGVAHLSELMVAAGERNHGIGARLLAAFEQWAAALGAHKLTLDTYRGGPAERFYARHGWHVAYVLANHFLHRDYVLMEKNPST